MAKTSKPIELDLNDLLLLQQGVEAARIAYRMAEALPAEASGLAGDLRRSAISVPSLLAGGPGPGRRERLGVAADCLIELESALALARAFDYLGEAEYEAAVGQIDETEARVLARLRDLAPLRRCA